MEYIYERNKTFEDFASGRVLYNAYGTTAFPVRLASEIIQRCFQILRVKGAKGPYSIYDPCCGGAYLLTVIGLLHNDKINSIFASDINHDVLGIAKKNLSLLTVDGLNQRKKQIKEYIELYNKASHISALESADRLDQFIFESNIESVTTFQSDVTISNHHNEINNKINIVITDLPYGDTVTWKSKSLHPIVDFFRNMFEILDHSHAVLAVIANKSQKLKHEKFRRIEHVKIGKRQLAIFEPISH